VRSARWALLAGCGLALASETAHAAPVRLFALIAGANDGGPGRLPLRYALSDAERFARVLVELGGVQATDAVVLKQPSAGELEQSLGRLGTRVGEAREAAGAERGGRIEVLVYYSGHADEKGLLLAGDRYSYRSLRDHLEVLPADVRIAVLDACASGAFTRLKGGRSRPAFLVDESTDMRGHAFLTSSSETEAAQESDRVGGSYFTHFLLSGLRGAADATGEGKVTLSEAYQFAFNETLGRTLQTKAGAQHPSYDINLSGSGDVVMTDLRETSAALVLGESLDGRFFVRNARQELVAELHKPFGRRIELGLEPGRYEVHLEREAEGAALVARTEVGAGAPVILESQQFRPTRPEPTRVRGGTGAPQLGVGHGWPFSFTASYLRTAYGSGNYAATSGDWQAEGVVRYLRGLFRIGVGAEVGKFDEPYSDPSFTAVGVFVEPGLGKPLTDRWTGSVGGRYGWAHERVGNEADGLWAWGWQASIVAGVDYRLGASAAAGLQLEVKHLSLRRDEGPTVPASGLSRRGWLYGLGLTLRVGGGR
jgi:Caspase domain